MIYHQPTKLYFGPGEIQKYQSIVEEDLRVFSSLLITDQGISSTGLVRKLHQAHASLEVFDSVEPNPSARTVNRIGDLARRLRPQLIIGLGGGSVLDAAKAAAVLSTNPGLIENYEGMERYVSAPLPVLAIPTTCGTGSEVTRGAVITDSQRSVKMTVKGGALFPKAAIVDPDLLESLPSAVVASTGLDALTHAIEAYTCQSANLMTDHFALKAVQLILGALEEAVGDIRSNAKARESLMYGSTLAGLAFGNSDVGAVHCLAESIGALFDIPHGVANSIFLPQVMRFNLPDCVEKYAALARAAGIEGTHDQHLAVRLIDRIVEMSEQIGIPDFQELNIHPDSYARIAEYAVHNGSNPSNPRPAGLQEYLSILEAVAAGSKQ